jgi:hypothetical protein
MWVLDITAEAAAINYLQPPNYQVDTCMSLGIRKSMVLVWKEMDFGYRECPRGELTDDAYPTRENL